MGMIDTALSIYDVMDWYLVASVFVFAVGIVWLIDFRGFKNGQERNT